MFIAGGARRMVCELCTARAANEGWLREGLDDIAVRRNGGAPRRRSLLGRLRQRRDAYVARSAEDSSRRRRFGAQAAGAGGDASSRAPSTPCRPTPI